MRSLLLVMLACLSWQPFAHCQEPLQFKVIVNSANPVFSLTKDELSRLFLKKTSTWSHGEAVRPVDQSDRQPVRDSFSKAIHNRPASAVKNYWHQQIFTGRGVPPAELDSDSEVLAFVKADPGAVGYVSAATSTDGVKVIEILP